MTYTSLEAMRDRVVSLCGDVRGARVLDASYGDGLIGRTLLPSVGSEGVVVFADRDAAILDRLASKLAHFSNAEFILTDARRLDGMQTIQWN